MKKTILLLIITAGFVTASAQMYNYLGNHIILNMEGYFSPAWLNPNPMTPYLNTQAEMVQRYLGLNYFLSPNIEMIVWKKGTAGVGYNYYNSPFKGSDIRVLWKDNEWGYTDFYECPGNITAHGFNVFYKQYVGDRFAPLGHYLKFIFDGYFYHYRMDAAISQVWPNEDVSRDEIPAILENKGSLFGMKVEYGYDFVVVNRLKLNVGASLGTTFGGYKMPLAKVRDKASYYNDPLDVHFDDYARTRILGAYWFCVKLGVGVIAF